MLGEVGGINLCNVPPPTAPEVGNVIVDLWNRGNMKQVFIRLLYCFPLCTSYYASNQVISVYTRVPPATRWGSVDPVWVRPYQTRWSSLILIDGR